MNIKEYIESGIVGSYVLGLASEAEQQEFESLCRQYPELIQAKKSFELALEAQLMKEAVPPPAGLKTKILQSLNTPGADTFHKQQREYDTPVHKLNIWKLAVAVCTILLAGSIYFAYSIRGKYQKSQIANIELKSRLDQSGYANPIKALRPIVEKPSIKWSAMLEPNSSHCVAHIYWDSLSTNTFLLIGNIPQDASNKQFQLWAVLDKHPINLGIFDIRKEGQLMQMKNVNKAKMFVITIEQKGGSPTPTMEAMYAVGNL